MTTCSQSSGAARNIARPIRLTRPSCSIGSSCVGCTMPDIFRRARSSGRSTVTLASSKLITAGTAVSGPPDRMFGVATQTQHHIVPAQRIAGATLSALGGICLAVQGRLNGQLGVQLHDGLLAGVISTVIGLTLLLASAAVLPSVRRGFGRLVPALRAGRLRWWECLGGVCGGFVVGAQGLTIPSLGVAVFTVAVVGGNV